MKIFSTKNNLNGEDFFKCRFYAKLHLLLNRRSIDKDMTMERVMNLPDEQIISLFLLGNRIHLDLIFKDVKKIYEEVSETDNMFIQALGKYVKSEDCSVVELEMLTRHLHEMGKEFQN